jgi:hypothetical protein
MVGLQDRAGIGMLLYTFARVGAVPVLQAEDYFPQGKRWWVWVHDIAAAGGEDERLSALDGEQATGGSNLNLRSRGRE